MGSLRDLRRKEREKTSGKRYVIHVDMGNGSDKVGIGVFYDGAWHHAAVTYDPKKCEVKTWVR
jgi:hypothetical protein